MDQLVVSGAREHNLKDITVAIPRDVADGHHRTLGVGKVVARLRHDLRRGAAPIRRVAVGLRAPVPGADGQAGRRLDRGALTGDLDRSEDDLAQPALDGRHGHRDLRLPAAAVGADRPSPLPHLRPADQRPVGRADHRPGDGAPEGTRFMVLAPIVRGRKGEYGKQLEELRAEGFTRVKVDGELRRLDEEIVLDKKYKHDIAVVVDRLVMKGELRKRLADSIETAVALADGLVEIEKVKSPGGDSNRGSAAPNRRRRSCSARGSPARSTGRAWSSSSRGSSASTRRTARVRAAPGSARRWRSTPSSSCPIRRCRSARARSRRGRRAPPTTTSS